LHADVDITTSNDVLGVEGTAKIYDAKLTNYGILPATIVVCDLLVASMPGTDLNYIICLFLYAFSSSYCWTWPLSEKLQPRTSFDTDR
jgi:hypothetical protein